MKNIFLIATLLLGTAIQPVFAGAPPGGCPAGWIGGSGPNTCTKGPATASSRQIQVSATVIQIPTNEPIVTWITPGESTNDQSMVVAITGLYFGSVGQFVDVSLDDPNNTVFLGQIQEQNGQVFISTAIPAGITPGVYNIRVRNNAGLTNITSQAKFTVKPQIVANTPPIIVGLPTSVAVRINKTVSSVSFRIQDDGATASYAWDAQGNSQITPLSAAGLPIDPATHVTAVIGMNVKALASAGTETRIVTATDDQGNTGTGGLVVIFKP